MATIHVFNLCVTVLPNILRCNFGVARQKDIIKNAAKRDTNLLTRAQMLLLIFSIVECWLPIAHFARRHLIGQLRLALRDRRLLAVIDAAHCRCTALDI